MCLFRRLNELTPSTINHHGAAVRRVWVSRQRGLWGCGLISLSHFPASHAAGVRVLQAKAVALAVGSCVLVRCPPSVHTDLDGAHVYKNGESSCLRPVHGRAELCAVLKGILEAHLSNASTEQARLAASIRALSARLGDQARTSGENRG